MLHLAMVRSPFAHATITSIDTEAAKASPNVVAVLTGEDLADEPGRAASTPGRSPPTRSPRRTRRCAVDRVAFAGEIVAVVVARSAAEARDAAELVDVEYDELPAALDLKEAAPRTRCLAHPDLGTNKSRVLELRLRRGRHRRQRRRGHREGPRRRHRDRAGVPPAAADPGLHGAALGRRRPDRRADHDVVGHPDPAHPAVRAGRDDRRARVEDPGDRPRRRRRLRRQARRSRRRSGSPSRWPAGSASRCKYTETRSESLMAGHHGRDQWQKLTLAAEKDGTVTGLQGRAARRPRLLRRARRRRRAGARRVHVQRDLQVPGLPVQLPDRAHQQDLDRRLPRRRPARRRRTPSSG